jgi:hypothetical protein
LGRPQRRGVCGPPYTRRRNVSPARGTTNSCTIAAIRRIVDSDRFGRPADGATGLLYGFLPTSDW